MLSRALSPSIDKQSAQHVRQNVLPTFALTFKINALSSASQADFSSKQATFK